MVAERTLGPQYAPLAAALAPASVAGYNAWRAPALAEAKAANVTRDTTAKQSREAGFSMPPGETNPTVVNKVLEGPGGTTSVEALWSTKKPQAVNDLGRRTLGVL